MPVTKATTLWNSEHCLAHFPHDKKVVDSFRPSADYLKKNIGIFARYKLNKIMYNILYNETNTIFNFYIFRLFFTNFHLHETLTVYGNYINLQLPTSFQALYLVDQCWHSCNSPAFQFELSSFIMGGAYKQNRMLQSST